MAKTTFVPGTKVTSNFLNAVNNIVFDGEPFDGHLAKITNNDLSDATGQIKPEWITFRDTLKVAVATGLSVGYQGGVVELTNRTLVAITPGVLVLPDNKTSFVFVNEAGAVVSAESSPLIGLVLANVVAAGGVITTVTDLRPRFRITPQSDALRLAGGNGDEGNYVLNSGTATLDQGEYFFRSLTVGATATLIVEKGAIIHVAGDTSIAGTLTVTTGLNGGVGINLGAGAVGLAIGLAPGSGPGAGVSATPSGTYNFFLFPGGSGGATGFVSTGSGGSVTPSPGGAGGGGISFDCGGNFVLMAGGTIQAIGGNGIVTTIINSPALSGGSGGGSGGLILIKSLKSIIISPGSTVNVRGGNGSNAIVSGAMPNGAFGGAGGGGGRIVLIAPLVNTTGATVILGGGTVGANANANPQTLGGAGGSFGGVGGSTGGSATASTSGVLTVRNFKPVA